ncbi:sensor histidine kinase [Robiginitalea sp.]|uniref:sensor histidine kinase n=1 Tax=Robiginitalea sp. TaxID=1902411 RepID=UPI003C4C397C
MEKKRKHLQRSQDASHLLQNTSLFAAIGCVLLAAVSWYFLEVLQPLPLLLIALALIFGLQFAFLRRFPEKPLPYLLINGLGYLVVFGISLYTGGVSSPFISVFALFILGGYLVKTSIGNLYLAGAVLFIGSLLIFHPAFESFESTVTVGKEPLFSALVFLFFLVVLGSVFGKRLISNLHDLYRGKEEMEQKANEKEMLLKEVHHRVKNNLQTVSSLLRMQGRAVEDPHTLSQIRSSQNRVVCMAMVHEMLYMREDLSCIEYSTYVQQLADYLVKSVKGSDTDIRLRIDIPEVELGIDTALPLGLLINEAVTNALKYGFEGRDTGEISISLEKEDEQGYVLRIGDDGVGYPENMDYKTSKSLGLKLIHNLSRQLKGSVIRDLSKRGTNYIIRFEEVRQDPFHSMA